MSKNHISNNKNILFYLIISFLILILIYNNNLAKKTYKIWKNSVHIKGGSLKVLF